MNIINWIYRMTLNVIIDILFLVGGIFSKKIRLIFLENFYPQFVKGKQADITIGGTETSIRTGEIKNLKILDYTGEQQ